MVPTLVAVLTGIGGLVVSAAITPFVTLRIARRGDATIRRAQDFAKSESDREAITKAIDLVRSTQPQDRRIGFAMLTGLSQMEGLSKDDALLVQSLMRPFSELFLSAARAEVLEGETVQFELEVGSSSEASEEGSDENGASH